jgi:hypothetical protein
MQVGHLKQYRLGQTPFEHTCRVRFVDPAKFVMPSPTEPCPFAHTPCSIPVQSSQTRCRTDLPLDSKRKSSGREWQTTKCRGAQSTTTVHIERRDQCCVVAYSQQGISRSDFITAHPWAVSPRSRSGADIVRVAHSSDYRRFRTYSTTQVSSTVVVSSTVAKTNPSSSGLSARPNADPGAGSTENCETNCPPAVNSTISLGWFGSGFTASPCVEIKSPFRANASPRGPCR